MPLTEAADCEPALDIHPWSRGQITRWLLGEVGAPYRQGVTECAAILAYLANAFPAAGTMARANNPALDQALWAKG